MKRAEYTASKEDDKVFRLRSVYAKVVVPNFCWAITSKTSNVLQQASSVALPMGLGFLCFNLTYELHQRVSGFLGNMLVQSLSLPPTTEWLMRTMKITLATDATSEYFHSS